MQRLGKQNMHMWFLPKMDHQVSQILPKPSLARAHWQSSKCVTVTHMTALSSV